MTTETTKTTAQQVAREMGDDGSRFTSPEGFSLHQTCRDHGAEVYRDERGNRSYRFVDGSAIAACGAAWDVVHADCTCLWCWAGERETHCEKRTSNEYRCTLTDDEADPTYKIESRSAAGGWSDEGVGDNNRSPSEEAAEAAIPELARCQESDPANYRIVES